MIVRYALKCEICEQPHTIRIGMGQDSSQTHKFPCRGCKEEIALRMDVDFAKRGWRVVCVENCQPILEIAGAPIVNVDANFTIPPEQQGVDWAFPRLTHMHAMHKASKRASPLLFGVPVPPSDSHLRPYRSPDYAEEWKFLRKAWSLARNGQTELSEKLIGKASKTFYSPEHSIDTLQNWIWRLATFLCNPSYEPLFGAAMEAVEPLRDSVLWWDFRQFYKSEAQERGTWYFNLIKDFFAAHSEFAQVYLFVVQGLTVPEDEHTTSTDFEAVKMFYGNSYEQFTLLVEYLAMLSNMLADANTIPFEI